MKQFVGIRPKTYSYLIIDDGTKQQIKRGR